jgi:hypothetical protein
VSGCVNEDVVYEAFFFQSKFFLGCILQPWRFRHAQRYGTWDDDVIIMYVISKRHC